MNKFTSLIIAFATLLMSCLTNAQPDPSGDWHGTLDLRVTKLR